MPELVTYKVRAVVEYSVTSTDGFGAAVAAAEERMHPALKYIEPDDFDSPRVRDAKIVDIEVSR